MRLIPIRKLDTITPPFELDVADLVKWVRPVTVLVRSSEGVCGGVLVSPNIVAVTSNVDDGEVTVLTPARHKVLGRKTDYTNENYYLSFYVVDELTEWVGLPHREEELHKGTFLFSFDPHRQERVYRFEPISNDDSRSVAHYQRTEKIVLYTAGMEHTLPVVDRFGYLLGLGIGKSKGETIVQVFNMKNSPL